MMKTFVVIGVGRFGGNLAKTLHSLGNEVLAIDENEDRINHISDFVTHAVAGDPKDEAVLKAVGVHNFDCAIVALSDDSQASILVTLMLKEMGVPYVVSKAISEMHARVLMKVGADKIVYPEKDMGMKVAQSLSMTNLLDFIDISDEYAIVEVKVPDKWVRKTIRELEIRSSFGVNIMEIKHKDTVEISVDPDYRFNSDDILVMIGSHKDIRKVTG